MKRILFVDDEVNVLDGLKNVLRKQRHVWEMVFAVGGSAALEELARRDFDVVVSDMRMPGMDGARLLQIVKDTYPTTARIVLSGHAERDAVMRALPVAHQYLSKPCDVEQLSAVIDRTCTLQALLHNESIRAMVSHLDGLPLSPNTYWEITQAAARPDIGLAEIGAIVEKDPALVAKILQLVNSAYFGLAQHIVSISAAVRYLGLDLIRGLALTEHVFVVAAPRVKGFCIEELRMHSVLSARLAKVIGSGFARGEDAFTAALVHDVGKIVLAGGCPEQFGALLQESRTSDRPFHELEQELFGTSHAEVGAFLLGVWGLPLTIVEAVAYHHRPGLVTSGDRQILAAVHLADVLVHGAEPGCTPETLAKHVDLSVLAQAGIDTDLSHWQAVAAETTHLERVQCGGR